MVESIEQEDWEDAVYDLARRLLRDEEFRSGPKGPELSARYDTLLVERYDKVIFGIGDEPDQWGGLVAWLVRFRPKIPKPYGWRFACLSRSNCINAFFFSRAKELMTGFFVARLVEAFVKGESIKPLYFESPFLVNCLLDHSGKWEDIPEERKYHSRAVPYRFAALATLAHERSPKRAVSLCGWAVSIGCLDTKTGSRLSIYCRHGSSCACEDK